jgi:hypothetical protein
MEPILVPGPPKTAFDKNRRMSDLIRKQIEHFKHLEEKLPPEVRATLPQHAIVTEDDAARYIAPMTQLLLARAAAVQAARAQAAGAQTERAPILMPQRGPTKGKDTGLDLAAAAGAGAAPPAAKTPPAPAAKKSPRKSSGSGEGKK